MLRSWVKNESYPPFKSRIYSVKEFCVVSKNTKILIPKTAAEEDKKSRLEEESSWTDWYRVILIHSGAISVFYTQW